ncbi:MAG: TolC family protein [Bacteroidales bacterium]|nr:TolC family protein [Bacteroidales bacterium]
MTIFLDRYKLLFFNAFFILLILFFPHEGKSQIAVGNDSTNLTILPDSLLPDSSIIDRIPPLNQLIDSAILHSGLMQRQIKQHDIKELERNTITQQWLKYINLFATTNYGVYDNFMSVQDQSVVGSSINTGTSFRWSVGVTVSGTPIYDFFNRPTVKKINELEAEQELDLKNDLALEIKKTVIQQLHKTLMIYRIMVIANENVYSNYTQLVMSERLFYQGEMELFDLANVREMYYKSLTAFEQNKYEFQMNYLILEAICGFQF